MHGIKTWFFPLWLVVWVTWASSNQLSPSYLVATNLLEVNLLELNLQLVCIYFARCVGSTSPLGCKDVSFKPWTIVMSLLIDLHHVYNLFLCRWHSSWRKQRGCTSASLRIGSSSSRPHPALRNPTGRWSMMAPHGQSSALVGGKNDILCRQNEILHFYYYDNNNPLFYADTLYLPQLDVQCLGLALRFSPLCG